MEQISLEKVNNNVLGLRQMIEEMKEILMEDELELADDVVQEIEESRKKPESSFISQEDIEAEFGL
jgi:hypothetical protein